MTQQNHTDTNETMPWNLSQLFECPVTWPADGISTEGIAGDVHPSGNSDVKGIFYEGVPWQGRPTRVFAWYGLPKGASRENKVPAMVLVHGGGATAYSGWVKMWMDRGYAAIAMDTCGNLPVGEYDKWQKNEHGGPAGWGGFDQIDQPMKDQWTYHAVASVIRGHSLIRSMPEVDANHIGITGISWGGYLTCIATGVDSRLACAVPIYGCGFIGDNSCWLKDFQQMGKEKAAKWLQWWDPSVYLKNVRQPMLWLTGTNDFAYPMDSLQKSYRVTKGQRTLTIRVNMPHGHAGAGENPQEILTFVDHVLKGGEPLPKVSTSTQKGDEVTVSYTSSRPIGKAELNYTDSTTPVWQERVWSTLEAALDSSRHEARANLPKGTTVYYMNLIDDLGNLVSSEHVALNVA